MRLAHGIGHAVQRLQPAVIVLAIGEGRIDAGLAGLLVLQQQVGDAAKGRDHEDPTVKVRARAVPDHRVSRSSSTRDIDVPPIFSTVCVLVRVMP